jgi:hypothetical protein
MYIYISMYVCPYLIVQARRTGILKPSDISALPKSAQDDWELNQSVRGTNTVDRASRLSILIEGVLAEGVAKRKRKKEKEREQGRKREREREREREKEREREQRQASFVDSGKAATSTCGHLLQLKGRTCLVSWK